MEKKNALAISLSQEELYVIMAYLGAKVLMGVDNAVKDLSDDQYKIAMRVAERALMAREFLIPDGQGKFKPADVIHAIIGACASPDETLIIRRAYPNKLPEEFLFHLSRKMIVLHTNPITAIHQFIALPNKDAMLKSASSILALITESKLDYPPASLAEEKLAQIRDLVQKGDLAQAKNILSQAGWEGTTGEAFVESLKTAVYSDTIAYVTHTSDGDGNVRGITVLKAGNGLWVLETKEAGSLEIKPGTEDEIISRIKKWLNN